MSKIKGFMQLAVFQAPVYWRAPFKAMCSSRQLVEYVVLDIEPLEAPQSSGTGKWQLAEAQVARSSDFGRNDTVYFCRTHLGHLLNPGDLALGYDLANANLVHMDFEAHVNRGGRVPDVVLVKKSYEEKRRRHKQRHRNWQLKHLDMEMADER
jgi:nonsense-mediated mRNA decay protein 3